MQRAKTEVRRPRLLRPEWLAPLALAGLTVAVFYPATGYPFVNYDDPEYVTANPYVTAGLSWPGAAWSLTTLEMGNWHPLNWLSLQADTTFYGVNPFGFHLTNVLLHAASVALLFLALRSLTGCFWRGLAVALLFAVHPLRVEPVAWVSERKGDLSVFFGLLALWSYAGYARRPSWLLYAATTAAFCASLMSKPALATLPFLLLVLDWWPLGRLQTPGWWRRVVEKVPLLVAAVGVSVVGYFAQNRIQAVLSLPLTERAANAVTRCVVYLRQTVWPTGLGVLYPLPSYPGGAPPQAFVLPALGFLALLAVTAGAFVLRRRTPYLLVGWLWFIGTLAPVVVVQISIFAHADRYTYFPQIGILIAVCWGVADLAGARGRLALAAAGVAALALAVLTQQQLATWKDSVTLWENAVRVGGKCPKSLLNLGEAYSAVNKDVAAIGAYREALQIDPDDPLVHANMGVSFVRLQRLPDALREYQESIRLAPGVAKTHFNYGMARTMAGDLGGAVASFREALSLQPDYAKAHSGLGIALLQQKGQTDAALAELNEALRLDPHNGEAALFLAKTLDERKDYANAARYAEQAVRYAPEIPMSWYHLGLCHLHLGQPREAARYWQQGLERFPGQPELRAALAYVRGAPGRPGAAP